MEEELAELFNIEDSDNFFTNVNDPNGFDWVKLSFL